MLGRQVEMVCIAVDGGRITTSLLESGTVSNVVDLHLLLLITFSNNFIFSLFGFSLDLGGNAVLLVYSASCALMVWQQILAS